MKRTLLISLGVLLLLVGWVLVLALRGGSSPSAPRFVPGAPPAAGGLRYDYNWLADAPFDGGKVWLWSVSTNHHVLLYDLEQHQVLGELFNVGEPILWQQDGSRLLCSGRDASPTAAKRFLRETADKLLKRLGAKPLPAAKRDETFWILDVRSNTANRVGMVSHTPGTGSRWHPSPSFRYGYTTPFVPENAFFLCDLERNTFSRIALQGELKGWWDDQHLLLSRAANTFLLLDIHSGETTPLFSPADIQAFLTQSGLTNDPAGLDAFANWNGHAYDFYFGIKGTLHGLERSESFLLKADRSGPGLKLLYRNFSFRWGGQLDPTGTRYLYQGESGAPGKGGDGSVYLRDLVQNSTITLVPPDSSRQYAIPRFYGDEVIYHRNRLLRRVKLDGSADAPLLPAAADSMTKP